MLLLFIGVLAGCARPEVRAADLSGIWRSVEGGEQAVILHLNEDGTFVRIGRIGDIAIKSGGFYSITPQTIDFKQKIKKYEQEEADVKEGEVLRVPYKIDGLTLVLYPESNREQRFLMSG